MLRGNAAGAVWLVGVNAPLKTECRAARPQRRVALSGTSKSEVGACIPVQSDRTGLWCHGFGLRRDGRPMSARDGWFRAFVT